MPKLSFTVESVAPILFAASPLLGFEVRITDGEADQIQSVALRCQIQIEPKQRRYAPQEEQDLRDLFGELPRWGQTLNTMLWTHANVTTVSFEGTTKVVIPVPCTFDFNVAATKFFYALQDGVVPLRLQFSGTVFYRNAIGALQIAPISWDQETKFALPVQIWKDLMNHYYPETAWLCLRRDTFDRIYRYKVDKSIPTWEEALERCVPEVQEKATR